MTMTMEAKTVKAKEGKTRVPRFAWGVTYLEYLSLHVANTSTPWTPPHTSLREHAVIQQPAVMSPLIKTSSYSL